MRPAAQEWPEAYAILTIAANADLAAFHDRQMVVLRRDQRMAWWCCPRLTGHLGGLMGASELARRAHP